MAQDIYSGSYDCIIFYRWFTPDGGYERGRIMARLIAEVLEGRGIRVWLDQHQMSKSTARDQVVAGIHQAFQRVQYVIILAAPGDWERFANQDDIHRWEWEISLKSGKPVWVLQYQTCPSLPCHPSSLASRLASFNVTLAELVSQKNPQIHTISTENLDSVLGEIVRSTTDISLHRVRRRRRAKL